MSTVALPPPMYNIGDNVKYSMYENQYSSAPSEHTGKITGIYYKINNEYINSTSILRKVTSGGTRRNRRNSSRKH